MSRGSVFLAAVVALVFVGVAGIVHLVSEPDWQWYTCVKRGERIECFSGLKEVEDVNAIIDRYMNAKKSGTTVLSSLVVFPSHIPVPHQDVFWIAFDARYYKPVGGDRVLVIETPSAVRFFTTLPSKEQIK